VGTVLRFVLGAMLRGKLSVAPAFLAAARRGAHVDRARRERIEALAALPPPRSPGSRAVATAA